MNYSALLAFISTVEMFMSAKLDLLITGGDYASSIGFLTMGIAILGLTFSLIHEEGGKK